MRCKGWEVIAIDPLTRVTTSDQNLSKKQRNDPTHNVKRQAEPSPCWDQINHLIPIRANVEDVLIECDIAIVVLMHCHVDLEVALSCINPKYGILAVMTCPCCQYLQRHTTCFNRKADINYLDYGILSDKREIRIWINDLSSVVLPNSSGSIEYVPISNLLNIEELSYCTKLLTKHEKKIEIAKSNFMNQDNNQTLYKIWIDLKKESQKSNTITTNINTNINTTLSSTIANTNNITTSTSTSTNTNATLSSTTLSSITNIPLHVSIPRFRICFVSLDAVLSGTGTNILEIQSKILHVEKVSISSMSIGKSQKMHLSTTFNGVTTAMLDEKNEISDTNRVYQNNYKKIYGDQIDYVDIQIVDVEYV